MLSKPKQKNTLQRHNPCESIFQNDIVIRISVTTAILIAFILFIAFCFLVQPQTYGFINW